MSCPRCGDKGMIRIKYLCGEPDEFAICVCEAGRWYRSDINADRHTGAFGWEVWAAREQIDPSRIALVEDLYDAQEMATLFPSWQAEDAPAVSSAERIADAMRTQRTKL